MITRFLLTVTLQLFIVLTPLWNAGAQLYAQNLITIANTNNCTANTVEIANICTQGLQKMQDNFDSLTIQEFKDKFFEKCEYSAILAPNGTKTDAIKDDLNALIKPDAKDPKITIQALLLDFTNYILACDEQAKKHLMINHGMNEKLKSASAELEKQSDQNQTYKSERHRKFDLIKNLAEDKAKIEEKIIVAATKDPREAKEKKEAADKAEQSKALRANNDLYNKLDDAAIQRYETQITALKLIAENDKALAAKAKINRDIKFSILQQAKQELDQAVLLANLSEKTILSADTTTNDKAIAEAAIKNKENASIKYSAAKIALDNADKAFYEAFAKAEKSRMEAEAILSEEIIR